MNLREMVKAKHPWNSSMSFLTNVLFPLPEGPHKTTGLNAISAILWKEFFKAPATTGKMKYKKNHHLYMKHSQHGILYDFDTLNNKVWQILFVCFTKITSRWNMVCSTNHNFAAETKFYDFFTSSLKAYIIKLRIQ